MPFVLAASVAGIGVAVLLAELCFGASYLLKAIGSLLPRITVPIVGFVIDLPGWFFGIAGGVESWLVNASAHLWGDVESWMRAIAYIAVGLFDDVKNAIIAEANNLAHLYNEVIPGAASHAQAVAHGYASQETQAITREIAAARAAVGLTISRTEAAQWLKDEQLAKTVKTALLAIIATSLRHGEHYTDQQIDALRRHLQGEIGAARPVVNAPPVAIPAPPATVTDIFTPAPALVSPADLAAVATVATRAAAAVATLTAEYESCAVRTCAGNNNFSNLLRDALGIAGAVGVGSFLAEVMNDPAAAVAKYSGEIESDYGKGRDALDALLSL